MLSRHFNFDTLNPIAADDASAGLAGVRVLNATLFGVLQANKPLDLVLHFWLGRVKNDIRNGERPQRVASGSGARVNALHLFKGYVGAGLLRDERLVVAWLLLGMRVV